MTKWIKCKTFITQSAGVKFVLGKPTFRGTEVIHRNLYYYDCGNPQSESMLHLKSLVNP